MNRLLPFALAAAVGLSACSKKDEAPAPATPAASNAAAPAPAAPATPPTLSASTPNTGKVLQVLQAGSYTYAEVESEGKKLWIAGGPIQIKAGDTVQWGNYAVMNNFNSKSLNRTFEQILFVDNWGPQGGSTVQVAPHGNMPAAHPAAPSGAPAGQAAAPAAGARQGVVKSVANAGGYTYLEVVQGGSTLWIAAPETAVKAGDKVSWEGDMVMRNFTAKSLGRTFDQIVFANGVTVTK
ncbi:MAG: GW dipeptide domain-containing protein [Actinomycetota bacterium]